MKKISLSLFAIVLLSACQEVGRSIVIEARQENSDSAAETVEKKRPTSGKISQVSEQTQIKSEINLKDGIKEGEAKSFYPSGELWKKVTYKNGQLHGLAEVYDKAGNLKRSVGYKAGKKHGYYTKYFKSGKERLQIEYYEDKPLPGLLRRNYRGEKIPEPTLTINLKGKVSTDPDVYEVQFVLSEKLKETRFYGLPLDKDWQDQLPNGLNDFRIPNQDNIAFLRFQVNPGFFLSNEHYVYAEFEVEKGLRAVVGQKVNYAFENH